MTGHSMRVSNLSPRITWLHKHLRVQMLLLSACGGPSRLVKPESW